MVIFERHSSVKSYEFSVHVFSVLFLNLCPGEIRQEDSNVLQNEDNLQAPTSSAYLHLLFRVKA